MIGEHRGNLLSAEANAARSSNSSFASGGRSSSRAGPGLIDGCESYDAPAPKNTISIETPTATDREGASHPSIDLPSDQRIASPLADKLRACSPESSLGAA